MLKRGPSPSPSPCVAGPARDANTDGAWHVAAEPGAWAGLDAAALALADWGGIRKLPPFLLSDGTGEAVQQTDVRLVASATRLCVRFDCEDQDIWATLKHRDDPLYEEEAVEVFLAPGEADPVHYFEFEVSPDGVLFDATIANPDSNRATMQGDAGWDCPGIRWCANRWDAENRWDAILEIPWAGLACCCPPPALWRANFFRIERPRAAEPEFSCWRPTCVTPPDFHQPACFGLLVLPSARPAR